MRIWSVHPRYLDRQGLTACWREALLAQKVLTGTTRGYRNHPQLVRLRVPVDTPSVQPAPPPLPPDPAPPSPPVAQDPGRPITTYLHGLADEAVARGYAYDRARILTPPDPDLRIEVTTGQLRFEWEHLCRKLAVRSPDVLARWADVGAPEPHPLFVVVPGPVAPWEVVEGR